MDRGLPILLYHDLQSDRCANEKTDGAARGTIVDAVDFEKQMRFFSEKGYRSISLDRYIHLRDRPHSDLSRSIVFTFDDGHISNYQLAFPILKSFGFTATFFIVADRIGQTYHMTADQIQELEAAGMEIGSHGLTHRYLPLLEKSQIREELVRSKKTLGAILRAPVRFFAYPGGHYNRTVLDLIDEVGYHGACSCRIGLNTSKTGTFLLKRIEMRAGSSSENLDRLFEPATLFLYRSVDAVKSILRKSLGLETYAEARARFHRLYRFKR